MAVGPPRPLLPPDPDNLARAWSACEQTALELRIGDEPLDRPRDPWLAARVIERRALTRATGENGLLIDPTLVMAGFDFESVWMARREFSIDGVPVPAARLLHIIESKQTAGRPKDHLFLATHHDAREQLLEKPEV